MQRVPHIVKLDRIENYGDGRAICVFAHKKFAIVVVRMMATQGQVGMAIDNFVGLLDGCDQVGR